MSRAVELATKCGIFPDSAMGLRIFNEHELEAFYHAARAEALREAAEWLSTFKKQVDSDWGKGYQTATEDTVRGLIAMADREGK